MPGINWLAVVVAAAAMFAVGGAWYSPALFYKQWQKSAGVSDEMIKRSNTALLFGAAFVLSLLMAANLAFFVAGVPDLGAVIGYSVAAGLGWATFALWTVALFERRPPAYFLINGGYLTVSFVVMGLILGLWR